MNTANRIALSRRISVAAAACVVLCSGYLILSYVLATRQAEQDKALLKAMEEAVKLDAAVSAELTAERERQTNRSLARDKNNERASKLLILGASLFLVAVNWRKSMEADPFPSLASLHLQRQGITRSLGEAPVQLWDLETTETPQLDLLFVEQIIEQEGTSAGAAVQILRAVQEHYGYLPDEVLKRVCELTEITPAQIAGTSSFYAQFRRTPVGKYLVRICHGTACHVSGATQVTEELRRYLSIPPDGDTDPSRFFTVEKVACLGCCSLAPVMMIGDRTVGRLTPVDACRALQAVEEEPSA